MGAWRRRWQQEFERLTLIEGSKEPSDLRRGIEDLLSDEQRSGRPPTFTAEQLTMIVAVACEAGEESGRPVARWTQREIIDEVIKRGIVESDGRIETSLRRTGRQRQIGNSEISGNTPGISDGPRKTHPIDLRSETQFLAESGRNPVQRRCSPSHPAKPLDVCRGTETASSGIHRILQSHHGETLSLDVYRPTAQNIMN